MIRETIAAHPQSSRQAIARQVCDRLGWTDARGKRKAMSAVVALQGFHRQGWIELPPARTRRKPVARQWELPEGFVIPPTPLACPLDQIQDLTLQPVCSAAHSRLWNGLIAQFHYQGYASAFGAQQRYLVQSAQGVLGAIGFSAAARHLKDRDQWIGWEARQRRDRRHLIVNNSRFLILPWVRVPNLASRLLSMAAKRLPGDFQQRYGYTPVLLETFVEQPRFSGSCYKAANWLAVGETTGRGRTDLRPWQQRRQEAPPLPIKSIWLYTLGSPAQVRAILCQDRALARGRQA
jgi:hypothetical protein